MFPRSIKCEDCGQIATVRGYGRVEYRWPKTTNTGSEPTTPTIDCVRLTIDCPRCGVKSQEFFPNESSLVGWRSTASAAKFNASNARRRLRSRRIGTPKRAR
jgi:hypothetical protein